MTEHRTPIARATMRPLAALAVLAAMAVTPAAAMDLNGFLQARGELDVALSASQDSYDSFWVGDQKMPTPGALGEIETSSLSLWAAYGLSDRLTLMFTLPYVDTEGDGSMMFDQSALQDATLLAAHRLWRGGEHVQHQLVGGLGVRTPVSDYEANAPVSVGDGTTDWLLRMVYQLRTGGFYFSQQLGFDFRGEDAPDGVPLYTEAGYTVTRWTFSGFYSKLLADGGTDIGDTGFTFPSNEEEYERAGAKVYVRVTPGVGLAASGYTTIDGRNTGDASGVSLSVVLGLGEGEHRDVPGWRAGSAGSGVSVASAL